MAKTALVTGGAGFIGSHLCDYLIENDNRVICVDNLITGAKKNIRHLERNKNFKFIQHDIVKPIKIKEGVDFLYNLASPASPVDYQQKPIETLLVNSAGIKNMLDLARKNKAKFLQASTSEVYGDPKEHPQKEGYWGNVNPVGVRSCYDEGKRFSEALTMAYRRKYNLDTKIVRIFNTYGPRMRKDDGRVIPNFIMQALAGKSITVYGNGQQTRSFCYISDMVEGIYKVMQLGDAAPINLGNPDEFTITELAERVIFLTNSKSEIEFKPLPRDDPARRRPDIGKAKELLGWKPEVDLEAGLKRTIDFFREK